MSQYEALIPSTTEASHRISIEKRELLPQEVIIATKPLDENDNCTQRPCIQGFGSSCTVMYILGSICDPHVTTWDLDLVQDLDW